MESLDRPEVRPAGGGLLVARELTAAERAACDAEPRPGVWADEPGADLRTWTQDQTDALVRAELVAMALPGERDEVLRAVGGAHRAIEVRLLASSSAVHEATCQRGGIDSDPLVRLLAFRAWSARDRDWFAARGVRKGEQLALIGGRDVALAWPGEEPGAVALRDARPGDVVVARMLWLDGTMQFRISDRPRDAPLDASPAP